MRPLIFCLRFFFSMTTNLHNFNKENFSNLLLLAVSNSFFLFNACLYKLLDGLAMGNPLRPALANVFLCHLESIIFTSCPSDIRPTVIVLSSVPR